MSAQSGQPDISMAPLRDLRFLDLSTDLAGRLAAGLLAEFGAEVVRLAPPDHIDEDELRPAMLLADHLKIRHRIDGGQTDTGADELGDYDGCVYDDADALTAAGLNPGRRHILLFTPPYLPDDVPWPSHGDPSALLHAYTGFAAFQASYAGTPVDLTYPYISIVQGLWAAACAGAAVLEREGSGAGQTVEVNGAHAANILVGFLYGREESAPDQPRDIGPAGLNPLYTRYLASDGQWVFVGALGPKFAAAALRATNATHLLEDIRIANKIEQLWSPANRPWVFDHFTRYFAEEPAAHWIQLLEEHDIPCTVVCSREEFFADAQVRAIGMVRYAEVPEVGAVTMPSTPISSIECRAVPDREPAHQPATGTTHSDGSGPLAGMRVASFGTYVAGPFAAALLAELGADVLKIEPPTGDPWRVTGFVYNRGTRSLAIDLSTPSGRCVIDRVLGSCDVILNNFRLGVMDRLGLDFSRLETVNPDALSVAVTAYGTVGPLAHKPGYDTVLQAAAGTMCAQGGYDEPVILSLPVNDHTTAVVGALAVVMGLVDRARTGMVRHLSTSLAATAVYLQLTDLVTFPGRPTPRVGGADFPGPCRDDQFHSTADGWVRVRAAPALHTGVLSETQWQELRVALPTLPTAEALRRLHAANVPAVNARTVSEVCTDSRLREAGLVERHITVSGIPYTQPGRVADFSRTPAVPDPLAPGLGEHTMEILCQAGYSSHEAEILTRDGVVACGSPLDLTFSAPYR